MPAVLVEAGFINNGEDNRIFDENFEGSRTGDRRRYFAKPSMHRKSDLMNTKRSRNTLPHPAWFLIWKKMPGHCRHSCSFGIHDAVIEPGGMGLTGFTVDLLKKLDNAAKMEQTLRKAGFSTYIVPSKGIRKNKET